MNIKHPTIVIVNGANWVGSKLVDLMIEQKGNVIVVDDFNQKNMPFIKRHSTNKHFVFIEKDKIATLKENFTHIKYFIHLKNDFDTSDDKISSRYFIAETKFIDEILSIALEKNSYYILTSSIHLHKDFLLKKNYHRDRDKSAYNESDLQDYVEKTVLEYVKKAGLNGRVARLGNIYGPEMDLDRDPLLKQILTDAIYRDEVRIYGDGLEYMYYVYISDAIQGILKTLFSSETKGKVYAITNPEEISILTIVNKVLALQPNAQRIKFIKPKGSVDPLYEKAYIPDENLVEIGWKPNVSFDRGVSQVFDYFRKDVSLKEQSGNQNFLDTTSDNDEGVNNDSIRFVFDDTINLANRFFGPSYETDGEQFQEFQKKLNNDDSPLYNLNKRNSSVMPVSTQKEIRTSNISKPKTKWHYVKYVILAIIFLLIYVFLIVPVIRFGFLFWKVNSTASRLDYYVSNNLRGIPETTNLEDETRRDFAGISWAINLMKMDKIQSNITSISRGLDNAVLAKDSIDKNNLGDFLTTNDKVQESSVNKIQDLLLLLNAAKTQLDPATNINLPFSGSDNALKIRTWAFENETKYSEKIKTN